MSDDLLSIPIPDSQGSSHDVQPGPGQEEAWRQAQEALNKVASKMTYNKGNTGGMQNNWNYATAAGSSFGAPVFSHYAPPQPPQPQPGAFLQYNKGFQPQGVGRGSYQQQAQRYNKYSGNFVPAAGSWNGQQQQQQKNNYQATPYQYNQNQSEGGGGKGFQPFSMGRGQKKPFVSNPMNNFYQSRPQYNEDAVKRYMERAFLAANTPEERAKTQEYLNKRVKPMMDCGTAGMINWDKEPLPHERNYQLQPQWTPVNQLPGRQQQQQNKRTDDQPAKKKWRPSGFSDGDEEDDIQVVGVKESSASKVENKTGGAAMTSNDPWGRSRTGNKDGFQESPGKQLQSKSKKQQKAENKKKGKKQQQLNQQKKWREPESADKREERARRFAETLQNISTMPTSMPIIRGKITRGTCTEIEKSYFRLTTAPDPTQVRPLEILRKSLEMVKEKYRQKVEYRYLSSQLRSIRQDLTVQGIRNEFTVTVYEINARISLQEKDREEFNQCQSQLKLLYRELPSCEHEPEFVSYRLLYYVAVNDLIDINSLLQELTPELKQEKCVQFALKVQKSVAAGNYVKLFKLFQDAPLMCPYIMDLFVERERKRALNIICKSYRQTIPCVKVSGLLGMKEHEFIEWMQDELKIEDVQVGGVIDCRISRSF